MPLVGAEVARVHTAFRAASSELDAVTEALGTPGADGVGHPGVDDEIEAALLALRRVISGLRETSDACIKVLAKHADISGSESDET
jgi:hypothetical protein